MIGLRELASLLAGAVVLFGSVLVPAGDEGAVAIETVGEDTTRALAEDPATIELGEVQAYDLVTSQGAPTPPASLEGGFEEVRFLTAPGATETVSFGDKEMPIPAGSAVKVEGVSGTIDAAFAQPGLALTLTGTATSLEIDPPTAPSIETSQGADASIPAVNVTLGGESVSSSFERGGAFDEIAFTVAPSSDASEAPALTTDDGVLPFEQTVRVRVSDYAGVIAVAEIDHERVHLELDGFGNVTVFGEGIDRDVHQEITVDTSNPNEEPSANFTHHPELPQAEETVHFRANASDELTIRSWDWQFGDGARSEAQHPEHAYANPGSYDVTLTVTDIFGRSDTQTRTIEIVNSRPIVSLDWSPKPVLEGQVTLFEANASDRDGDIVSYDWSIPNRTGGLQGPFVNHTFAEQGIYDVGVVVTDEEGAQAETDAEIRVENAPPEANFTIDPSTPMARETVFLESTSSDYGDGEVVDHDWQISSVGSRSGEVVKLSFPRDGQQEIELRVRDDEGATDTQTRNITVRNAPPEASIRINPQPINPDTSTEFSADVSDDDPIQQADWTFSDGVERDGLRTVRTFPEGGTYDVTLSVQDTDGAWTTVNRTFTVNNAPDVALGPLNGDPTEELAVQTSELFTLTARVDDPDSDEASLAWNVDGERPAESSECTLAPEGNRSRLQCGWPDDGTHLISARVRDEQGATDTAHTKVLVLNRAPSVNPSLITDVVNVGETVTMEANAEDPDGTVQDVIWIVEGAKAGVGDELHHRFDQPGNHTVEVRASDDDHAVGRTTFHVDVNQRPTASISHSPDQAIAGEPVTFTAQATDPDGDDTELAYEWTFGEEGTASGSQATHTFDTGGSYWIQLAVTDEVGATIHRQLNLDVDTPPLGADLQVDPNRPQAGEQITFTASVEDGREIEKIEWNFGDGATETTGPGVQSTTHTYDRPTTFPLHVEIHADHDEQRKLNADIRVTGATDYVVEFEPLLPNKQCLNLDSELVEVQATNLATATTIGLQEGDVTWQTVVDCNVRYTLPAGTWSIGDRLNTIVQAGPAETTDSLVLPEGPLLDHALRMRYAPLSFDTVDVVSPNQASQTEDNATYSDPTQPVYVTGQASWVEGTIARDVPLQIATSYRGADGFEGVGIEYHDDRSRIPSNGTFFERVPAPVLEADPADADYDFGPGVAYLPGQYRVELVASSGLASDTQTGSFVEDPEGIFASLEGPSS